MRGSELDLVRPGPEERTGRLSVARRDALGVAGRQVERVDLIERIARLTLALKHEPLAVGRPVAFARATAFDRQPADAREEIGFVIFASRAIRRVRGASLKTRPYTGEDEQQNGQASPLHDAQRLALFRAS